MSIFGAIGTIFKINTLIAVVGDFLYQSPCSFSLPNSMVFDTNTKIPAFLHKDTGSSSFVQPETKEDKNDTGSFHTSAAPAVASRVLLGLSFMPRFRNPDDERIRQDHHKPEFLGAQSRRHSAGNSNCGRCTQRFRSPSFGWLDRAYPDRPLFGTTSRQAAEMLADKHGVLRLSSQPITRLLSQVFGR